MKAGSIPIVARIWTHGWLMHDTVAVPAAPTDAAVVERYVGSKAFGTSFVPNDADETPLHGPLRAEVVAAADYVPLAEADLEAHLATIEMWKPTAENAAEHGAVLELLRAAYRRGKRCYALRLDERHTELHHEWGFVIWVFRELLFIGDARDSLERFVLGFD